MSIRSRVDRLERAAAMQESCDCKIDFVEIDAGQEAPPLPPCPACERRNAVRRIIVVRPDPAAPVDPARPLVEVEA